jgi:hypothetical protein
MLNLTPSEDFQDPKINHRHVSRLFGLFPGAGAHNKSREKTQISVKLWVVVLLKRPFMRALIFFLSIIVVILGI